MLRSFWNLYGWEMFENEAYRLPQHTADIPTFNDTQSADLAAGEKESRLDAGFAARLSLAVEQAVKTGESIGLQIISLETPASAPCPIEVFMMEAARRIDELIRGFDAATYLGRGRFAVLHRAVSGRKGVAFLTKGFLATLAEPFSVDRQVVSLDVNIGFSLYETGICCDELLSRAEYALQKAQGGSCASQCYETVG